MAVPKVSLEAVASGPGADEPVIVLGCECGTNVLVVGRATLDEVINAVAEHNYAVHLRPDNTGLRVRR